MRDTSKTAQTNQAGPYGPNSPSWGRIDGGRGPLLCLRGTGSEGGPGNCAGRRRKQKLQVETRAYEILEPPTPAFGHWAMNRSPNLFEIPAPTSLPDAPSSFSVPYVVPWAIKDKYPRGPNRSGITTTLDVGHISLNLTGQLEVAGIESNYSSDRKAATEKVSGLSESSVNIAVEQ
ncbi:hypothetical protein GGX14DRAFT_397947 [Mycena pura]|uniref:Uncharacterized protein n=1 Tax=Mycena pura TaxID=153505 RepID=A0AAD6V9W0_9AGAR|nr:hypothetical protein GGX14DRAFT_397947 [Mycena pura]